MNHTSIWRYLLDQVCPKLQVVPLQDWLARSIGGSPDARLAIMGAPQLRRTRRVSARLLLGPSGAWQLGAAVAPMQQDSRGEELALALEFNWH